MNTIARIAPFTLFLAGLLAAVPSAAATSSSSANSMPLASGPPAAAQSSAALRSRYAEVRERLEKNAYGRPLALDSGDGDGKLKGEVYAVFNHPFSHVAASLSEAAQWCNVLMLPFNTKNCTAGDASRLALYVGRKTETPVEEAFRLDFNYKVAAKTADYLRVALDAGSGPVGTSDYRIVLQATPLDAKRTFVHLHYSYSYGTMSKVAMSAYLSTAGASKVGFTAEGNGDDGKPRLVGGMRGVMERNTMRYALAIDAWLGAAGTPEDRRVSKLVNDWFSATEKYPRQLREIERAEYVPMKEREFARMKAG